MQADQSGTDRNLAMMAEHGIATGQVRRYKNTNVVQINVLGPGEHWPRNGKGLVRATITWGDQDPEPTHYWPGTLAKYPLVEG